MGLVVEILVFSKSANMEFRSKSEWAGFKNQSLFPYNIYKSTIVCNKIAKLSIPLVNWVWGTVSLQSFSERTKCFNKSLKVIQSEQSETSNQNRKNITIKCDVAFFGYIFFWTFFWYPKNTPLFGSLNRYPVAPPQVYGQSPGGFVRPPGTCCDAHLKNVDADGGEKRSISKNNAGDIHKCKYIHIYTLYLCLYIGMYISIGYMYIYIYAHQGA